MGTMAEYSRTLDLVCHLTFLVFYLKQLETIPLLDGCGYRTYCHSDYGSYEIGCHSYGIVLGENAIHPENLNSNSLQP